MIGILNKNNIFCIYYEIFFKYKDIKNYLNFLGILGLSKEKDIIKEEIFYLSYNILYFLFILLIN